MLVVWRSIVQHFAARRHCLLLSLFFLSESASMIKLQSMHRFSHSTVNAIGIIEPFRIKHASFKQLVVHDSKTEGQPFNAFDVADLDE
jgi:hypothetical protein